MISDPDQDAMFMAAALAEARKGSGKTCPNPAVGAVIVSDGAIIATGYHRAAGQPHAEIEAIRALVEPAQARGSSIYITLEPCSTAGRTPPCTSAIIEHGFARVVYGATDPNPAHAGRADRILLATEIDVKGGVLADECAALNEAWNHWIVTGMPYVIAKCGMSLDGKISSHPASRWITSPAARKDAMRLRAGVDAVLVGANTARIDNPKLTVRGIRGANQPVRAVWSPKGELPSGLHLLSDRHHSRTRVLKEPSLREALKTLGAENITSVLIEGGGRTLGAAFDDSLVQRVEFYIAPVLLGGPVSAVGGLGVAANTNAISLLDVRYEKIGPDLKISGRVGCKSVPAEIRK